MKTKSGRSVAWKVAYTIFVLTSMISTFCLPIFSADYAKTMSKKVKSALGGNSGLLKGFEWIPTPTTNFGIMTSFVYTGDKKPSFLNEWCAGFSCLGQEMPQNFADVVSVNGFADTGASGTITLSETEKKSLSLGFLLPAIYNILNVGGGFDKNSVLTTTMNLGTVHVRALRKGKVLNYLNGLQAGNENRALLDALTARNLGMVVADVMVESMTVTLKPKTGMNVNLDAALNNPIPGSGILPKIFGATDDKKPSLTIKVSRSLDGVYEFTITQPVIVARLVAQYPIFSPGDGSPQGPSPAEKKLLLNKLSNSSKALNDDWGLWTLGRNCSVSGDICVATDALK